MGRRTKANVENIAYMRGSEVIEINVLVSRNILLSYLHIFFNINCVLMRKL